MVKGVVRGKALEKATHVKRLRGWQLEKESGRKPLEKGKAVLEKIGDEPHSRLANKLLGLWAHGLLSAILIRDIADLAIQDGATHPQLFELAQAGTWGSHPGNAHRDLLRTFCPNVMLPQPFQVKVGCIDPKTSKDREENASIMLPHLMFWKLGECFPAFFHTVFCLGKDSLEKFCGKVWG